MRLDTATLQLMAVLEKQKQIQAKFCSTPAAMPCSAVGLPFSKTGIFHISFKKSSQM